MSDHLPECPAGYVADLCTTDIDPVLQEPSCNHCVGQGCICICDQLRACEQRVRKDEQQKIRSAHLTGIQVSEVNKAYVSGYERALDAAREAVDRVASDMANWSSAETTAATSVMPDLNVDQWIWAQRGMHRALAAIDALREVGK